MNSILICITGVLGASLTFYVNHDLKQGPVRASAMLSLFVGLFFYAFPELCNAYLTEHIPVVFIGTSFIGMVSSETNHNYLQLALAGALFSLIYINGNTLFKGFGGALGALALTVLVASLVFSVLFSKSTQRLRLLKKYLKK